MMRRMKPLCAALRPISILFSACLAVSPLAHAQWSSNSAANTPVCNRTGDQAVPKSAAGGDGSTWIGWFDNNSGNYDVFVQKLDVLGNEVFPHNGLLVSNHTQSSSLVDWDLQSDGSGGCVLAFTDVRAGGDLDVYAYRIDGAGNSLWGANGVTLSSNGDFEANPKIARTSDGSFAITWTRQPSPGPGAVHVQKLDPAGTPQFAGDGLQIVGPNTEKPGFSFITAADNGGYILGWVRDISTFASPRHIHTQKIDAAGNLVWNGGATVVVYDTNAIPIAHQPLIVSDGQGGALYGWHRSTGSNFEVLVQHVDASGTEVFPHNGLSVSTDTTIELDPAIAFLPASGDLVVAFDKRNSGQSMWSLSVQRISAAGVRLWTNLGLDLMPLDATVKSIVRCAPFGDGALVFCHYQPNMASLNAQITGFRLDANGASQWTPAPLIACSLLSQKLRLSIAIDGTGIARLVWGDGRNDIEDIYAQNVNCDATLGNTSPCGTTNYCVGAPNSVGPGAVMGALGSTCSALNNFTLKCAGLPPNSIGLFFFGPNAIQQPFGNGFRCVGGSVIRLGPPQVIAPTGETARFVDANVVTQITAGSTQRFQFWYRNVAGGGAGFNLSDGLTAVFCP